ncbi:hypothetical protein SYNTR_0485 [Candidatus Syntrophocurvum alkaliphilum]|uniref:Archaeal/vacuolar-type H+-ATPase subunit H n=1 Tax=Candidatus Syntrophocurvum alkaliphilum TaxID=2293317 RepID=A0A6I6DEZ5_9FIRM|nr:ATPase [Candidatus Syntrophocurvum alkaliphilum]QGT99078.1 hypothetical protein SYNTR_0485 [Candidatus Syntrophocurvum alkaliphilum]
MMEIYSILDELEHIIKESKKVPFSNSFVVIDSNNFLDRLDKIRAVLPEELEIAKNIITEKDKIVEEACAEAETFIEEHKDKAAKLIDNNEITHNAMVVAEDVVNKAEITATEIRREANEYADDVLKHIEIVLQKGLDTVSEGRNELKNAIDNNDV